MSWRTAAKKSATNGTGGALFLNFFRLVVFLIVDRRDFFMCFNPYTGTAFKRLVWAIDDAARTRD